MLGEEGVRENTDELARAIRARTAPLLPVVLYASLAVLVITTTYAWLRRADYQVAWWTYGLSFASTLVALAIYRSGRPRAAGITLSLGMWGVACAGVFSMGGPTSPAAFIEFPVILTAALFWSWRAAGALSAATIGVVVWSAWLAGANCLGAPREIPLVVDAFVFSGSLAMAAVLAGATMRSLSGAVAEAAGRTRELEMLFRESPDAVALLDDMGIVRAVNPAALSMGRFSRDEVVGRHFASLPIFPGNEGALGIRRFRALLRGGPRGAFDLHLLRRDGSQLYCEARSRVIASVEPPDASAADSGRRVQVIMRDVTQRKLSELRRAELETQLLRLQRFETLGRLSGAVAHDVNNLLSVIALVASSLRDRLGPEARDQTDELFDSAMRAAKLNRRLLSLGRQDLVRRELVDVNLVIEGMRRLLQRIAGASLELVVSLDTDPCFVRADTAQLEQIIINLVTNARDAMPADGRLTIETAHARAAAQDGADAQSVVVRVSDTGMGMDEATRRRIFEPFFTTKGALGTGLGLATVRDIAKACGGDVSVESFPGEGTRFEVLLPELSRDAVPPSSDRTNP